jgi:sialic acid synthase SpsE
MNDIKLTNGKTIGTNSPVFIIAEIGYNYNTMEEAIASIDAAVDCGVDAVKFQTFKADTIVRKDIDFPIEAGGGNQWEEFKKYELSADDHKKLFDYSTEKGLIPFSTPSHITDLPLLEDLGMEIYKLGADDLTNIPFQVKVAKLNKPLIISTGMGYLSEVARTVEEILETGNDKLIVLHCISNYPIKDITELNLKSIKTMYESMGILTGFSDHTETFSAPVASVALGSCVYERHFTLDKNIDAPDCALSADPEEMKQIVTMIRETEQMLGNGIKQPAKSEIDMRRDTRKSLVSLSNISKGEILSSDNVTIKRPGHGIDPVDLEKAMGRKVNCDIAEDVNITWEMLG